VNNSTAPARDPEPAPEAAPKVFGVSAKQGLIATSIVTTASLILYGVIPEASSFLIVALTWIPTWWMLFYRGRLPLPSVTLAACTVWALAAWITASALWSPSSTLPLHMAGTFCLYALCIEAWGNFSTDPAIGARERIRSSYLMIFPLIALYVATEALSGMAIRNSLTQLFPVLMPRPHHMTVAADGSVRLNAYMLNRNVAVLICLFWPMALMARAGLASTPQRITIAAGTALCVLAIIAGNHGSSKLALAASTLIFCLALWRYMLSYRLVQTVWTGLCLLVVPVALSIGHTQLHRAEPLPYSTAHRLLIWSETARAIIQHPIIGAGSGATRIINAAGSKSEVRTPRFVFPAGLNLHAHNIYLQTWFELGAVGAILLWLIGLRMLGWVAAQTARVQPYLLAAFTTGAALGSTSYAYNDPWFMASLSLIAIFSQVAVAINRDRPEIEHEIEHGIGHDRPART
jgi:O-antigen ligase